MKGSGLSPQDSSRLRVKVPLWLSWLNTSVSKQSQAYKDKYNKNLQDIKYKCEREMTNHKYGRFVSRFEHTCSKSPPSTLWRIFTITIPQDHPVLQHLQRVHIRTLGPASPSLVPSRTTHACPQARRGRNLYNSSKYKNGHLVISKLWSPTNILTTRISIGWI